MVKVSAHRELACPCRAPIALTAGRYVCAAGHEHERLAALEPTGRTRPYAFVTGRYPEEEPWRGRATDKSTGA